MNLVWHIVRKDARRLRWPLAAWAGLIVVQWLIGLWMVTRADFDLELAKRLAVLQPVLLGAQWIAAYLMVAWLVHEDLVIGVRSHWMTLPISGWRLCAAKFLALALFFWVLPCLLTLPWWLACGFGLPVIAGLMGQAMVLHAAVTLPALPVAVLSDNWTRFLTWTLVLVIAVITGVVATMAQMNLGYVSLSNGIWQSRVVLVIFIWLMTIAGVTVHQFLTRRTERSIGIAATGVVGALAVLGGWSHDLSPGLRRVLAPMEAPLWHNAIHVEAGTGESASRVSFRPIGSKSEAVLKPRLNVTVDDLAGQEVFYRSELDAEWRWPDGVSWKRHATLWVPYDDGNAWLEGMLNPTGVLRASREIAWTNYLGDIPPSLAAKMLSDPPTLRGRLVMRVYRLKITGEAPMVAGARLTDGMGAIRLGSVNPAKDGRLEVTAVVARPWFLGDAFRFGPLGLGGMIDYWDWYDFRRTALVAVNRAARNATDGMGSVGPVNSETKFSTGIAGVEISWQQLKLVTPRKRKPAYRGVPFIDLREKYEFEHMIDVYEPPDPHWFDGAKLVSLATTSVGRLETTFTIERFETKEEQRRVSP